jgi:hypothetical protein
MSSVIRLRRGTSAQWATSTIVLATAELGLDTTLNKLKVGNGMYTWPNLPFINVLPSEIVELAQDAVGNNLSSLFTYNDSTGGIGIDNAQLSNFLLEGASGNSYGLIGTSAYLDVKNSNGYNKEIELDITAVEAKLVTDGFAKTNSPTLSSPALTGIPTAPTAVSTVNTTQIATTEFVQTAVANIVNSAPAALNTLKELSDALGADSNYASTISTALGLKAPLASPTFSGTVSMPETTSIGDVSSTEISYLNNVTSAIQTQIDLKAPSLSPTFTGTVSGITKTMVGLGNVDNTSDLDKPVSSAASLLLGQLQTSLTDGLAAKVDKATIPSIKSDTAYTIDNQTDRYNRLEFDSSSAITVTIPTNINDPWPVGSSCEIMQAGTGKITVVGQSGVTLRAPDNQFKTRVQWSTLILEKRGTNDWLVSGDSDL